MVKVNVPFEKLERGGQVAILYSPDFGAGWSTWNKDFEFLLFDKELVQLVLDGKKDAAAELATRKANDAAGEDVYLYTGGACNLEVAWLPKGSVFKIDEYDGSESITLFGDYSFRTA